MAIRWSLVMTEYV